MTHDAVLVFAKSWGAIYLLVFFIIAVFWAYWPGKKATYDRASKNPLNEDDTPCR